MTWTKRQYFIRLNPFIWFFVFIGILALPLAWMIINSIEEKYYSFSEAFEEIKWVFS